MGRLQYLESLLLAQCDHCSLSGQLCLPVGSVVTDGIKLLVLICKCVFLHYCKI